MTRSHPVMLSIVIPALNEAAGISRLLNSLNDLLSHSSLTSVEILVVDGGSQDDTIQIADRHGVRCITARQGRAPQMNAGWRSCQGDLVLFLHADSIVTSNWFEGLTALCCHQNAESIWGRFNVRIEDESFVYRVIEFMINLRSRLTGISTGDQAQFVSRSLLERIGGFPDQALMEDIELCKRLKKIAKPVNRSERVVTSARRWQQGGVLRTVFLMWRLRWAYFRGASPGKLAAQYRNSR